ncbi:hypothetical protein L248_2100 [Schleiferilactobacillus shenzhenensis LY-73]|uniref:Winged helix DNA-binding domain-containing protein n=2 Tax=Schleiferilactobacillus shenzhenensis TaxID=1231337 RepID=U4TGH9_9LACO|nr:hypothetical protein L248_2100 [Schleiferilactobacillus shenzhenensis LY-73]
MNAAVGTIGMQNTPPGAWEQAVFNRVSGVTAADARAVLEEKKTLVQAWSFRGAPVVFPTANASIFLTALEADPGEEPWIYTAGLMPSLETLGFGYDDLRQRVTEATESTLRAQTIAGKSQLDAAVADHLAASLSGDLLRRWQSPSPYGARQTLGQAAVSFMLRPASFTGQVVFGRRDGQIPAFTSPAHWGVTLSAQRDAAHELVRRFVHAYGPTNRQAFTKWLGCSTAQGRRLWSLLPAAEITPIGQDVVLTADVPAFGEGPALTGVRLLGAHDPFLDANGRDLLLPDKTLQKKVWRLVGNPGVILVDGRIAGIWRQRAQKNTLAIMVTGFGPVVRARRAEIVREAEKYAAFCGVDLGTLAFSDERACPTRIPGADSLPS